MSRRIVGALVGACLAGALAVPAEAHRVLGFGGVGLGAKPAGVPQRLPDDRQTPAAATTRSGIFEVRVTMNILTTLPAGHVPYCQVRFSHLSYTEAAAVAANKKARKATCDIRVPYKWGSADSQERVFFSIDVIVLGGQDLVEAVLPLRQISVEMPPFRVPANGVTRTFAVVLDL